jgi:SPP1 family predicted phage head-tail adaptor
MRAGRLDRRITIEGVGEGRTASGDVTETWSTVAVVWAGIRAPRGDEVFAAREEQAERELVFRIRWRSDVTAKMRIQYDGLTWDIEHVAEIGRREGLELRAKARGG